MHATLSAAQPSTSCVRRPAHAYRAQDLPVFDLMSVIGKIRAGLGAMGLRPPPPGNEESVEAFVRRNLVRR